MATTVVSFDAEKLARDIALRGWLPIDLARKARVSDMTVYRFLQGKQQSPRMAKKFARVLGYSVRRYVLSAAAAERKALAS